MNRILMTATISPSTCVDKTLRADPAVRRRDYEEALRFYLRLPHNLFDEILFCENSGADLGSLREIARTENPNQITVRFHSSVSDCPVEYGKGHAELYLMDRVYRDLIEGHGEDAIYWKVTGRLKIRNIASLAASASKSKILHIDMRLVPPWLRFFGTDRWADTRVFGFTPEGYRRYLLGKFSFVGTPGSPWDVEMALFPIYLKAVHDQEPIAPRFRVQPVMEGIGAQSGKNYNDLLAQVKNIIRRFTRRFAPNLWL